MKDQKEVLQAYLEEALAARGMTLDAATLDLLNDQVSLAPRPTNESEETRTITQKIDREGKHTAESFKLFNIMQLSVADLMSLVGQYASVAMLPDTVKELIFGFILLLIDFHAKLKVQFSEQEARVIYAIAQLKSIHFTTSDVQRAYLATFPEGITTDKLEDSMEFLIELDVLKRTAVQAYELREKIKNLSR